MLRFKSLESRIVVVFIVLLLLLQSAGFVVIRSAIEDNARTAIRNELVIGERVFLRLLDQNAQKLMQGARLLASDYGFRAAIGSDDRETIVSALANHGARIGATMAMLIGTDDAVRASTLHAPVPDLVRSARALAAQAAQGASATANVLIEHHLYQLVAVPVKAPLTIGSVVMGFPVDNSLIDDMKALTSLKVAIMVRTEDGNWKADVSNMTERGNSILASQLLKKVPTATEAFMPELQIGSNDFSARVVVLAREGGASAVAVLQRSISEAVAPYRQLQLVLLLITALGVLLSIAGSTYTARRITRPLRQLADSARRLGEGDYTLPVVVADSDAGVAQAAATRNDEIGRLARAFEKMRQAIATRQAEILRLAYQDPLTDLPNRVQFNDLLKAAIVDARARRGHCTVLMLDLHRFQQVNDVLGHAFGDLLLRRVGERLSEQLAPGGCVARLGGDEFAILLPDGDLAMAQREAERINRSLETPISLEDQTIDLGAGIGIAGFPEHGDTADLLLSRAEVTMYAAKRGAHEILVYDTTFDRSSQESLSLLGDLRRALDRHEFQLYAQPKLDLATGQVVGVESLVRWIHPEKGMIGPDNFIPFAESSGFIRQLTFWMLEQGALLCRDLRQQDIAIKISINLSMRDLLDHELPQKFADILTRYGVPANAFCLEITESAIMDDPVRAQQTLERLCEMGSQLSIDDFGTGYSSLAYLKRLPVHELKIDKSFVMNMESDADDAKIVRSTIDLGHNMGLRVVAEGIENVAVWHLLAHMGCDQAQGYFMSRPLPVGRLVPWIKAWQPPPRTGNSDGAGWTAAMTAATRQ